jgi:hypothetical protein
MDPEQVAIDREAVNIARAKRFGRPERLPSVHAQSHFGPSFNLPAVSTLRDDVYYRESIPGIISQILAQRPSPLMDRMSRR